jgi:hypothetical protein
VWIVGKFDKQITGSDLFYLTETLLDQPFWVKDERCQFDLFAKGLPYQTCLISKRVAI